jgi:hypothetical protein
LIGFKFNIRFAAHVSRKPLGGRTIMHRTISLLFVVLIGCSGRPIDEMDRNEFGQPTLGGLLLIESVNNFPIGLTSKAVLGSLDSSPMLKIYNQNDSLFSRPFSWLKELKGIHETVFLSKGAFYPYFRLDFFHDTCVTMFFMDTTHNQQHVTACVDQIASKFGRPEYDHYDNLRTSAGALRNVDIYRWKDRGITMTLQHRKELNDFWFEVENDARWTDALHIIDSVETIRGIRY